MSLCDVKVEHLESFRLQDPNNKVQSDISKTRTESHSSPNQGNENIVKHSVHPYFPESLDFPTYEDIAKALAKDFFDRYEYDNRPGVNQGVAH